MSNRYGRNLHGAIVERSPDSLETYELFWQAGDTICASDGGMNLLFGLLKDLADRTEPKPLRSFFGGDPAGDPDDADREGDSRQSYPPSPEQSELAQARAEVPEWCRQFIQKVRDSFMVGEHGGYKVDKEGISDACHMLTETRLHTCGIEP